MPGFFVLVGLWWEQSGLEVAPSSSEHARGCRDQSTWNQSMGKGRKWPFPAIALPLSIRPSLDAGSKPCKLVQGRRDRMSRQIAFRQADVIKPWAGWRLEFQVRAKPLRAVGEG